MSDACNRLIGAAQDAAQIAKNDLDACMLQSMATCFRHGQEFSFNGEDMADLCERMAVLIVSQKEPKT